MQSANLLTDLLTQHFHGNWSHYQRDIRLWLLINGNDDTLATVFTFLFLVGVTTQIMPL